MASKDLYKLTDAGLSAPVNFQSCDTHIDATLLPMHYLLRRLSVARQSASRVLAGAEASNSFAAHCVTRQDIIFSPACAEVRVGTCPETYAVDSPEELLISSVASAGSRGRPPAAAVHAPHHAQTPVLLSGGHPVAVSDISPPRCMDA